MVDNNATIVTDMDGVKPITSFVSQAPISGLLNDDWYRSKEYSEQSAEDEKTVDDRDMQAKSFRIQYE